MTRQEAVEKYILAGGISCFSDWYLSADWLAGSPNVTGCRWTYVVIFPSGTALINVHLFYRAGNLHVTCKAWVLVWWRVFLSLFTLTVIHQQTLLLEGTDSRNTQ